MYLLTTPQYSQLRSTPQFEAPLAYYVLNWRKVTSRSPYSVVLKVQQSPYLQPTEHIERPNGLDTASYKPALELPPPRAASSHPQSALLRHRNGQPVRQTLVRGLHDPRPNPLLRAWPHIRDLPSTQRQQTQILQRARPHAGWAIRAHQYRGCADRRREGSRGTSAPVIPSHPILSHLEVGRQVQVMRQRD